MSDKNLKSVNKIVRDRVLEALDEKGLSYTGYRLTPEEFSRAISEKLDDEVNEFHQAFNSFNRLEEAADILEVLLAKIEADGWHLSDLLEMSKAKREDKGAFEDRIFLETIEEEPPPATVVDLGTI